MAYNANDPTQGAAGGQDPFNYQRNIASQRASGQQQANFDALQRRFANNGGMNSGAAIQAEQNANRDVQQNLENTQGNIGFEQSRESIPFQLQSQNQAFQGQQAELSREQQKEEFGKQLGQQESPFGQELPLRQRALDLEAKQQGLDEQAMNFNEGLAQWQQAHSGGLFGAGGFAGLGL